MGLTTKSEGKKTTIYADNGSSYAEMTNIVNGLINSLGGPDNSVIAEDEEHVSIGVKSESIVIAKAYKLSSDENCEGNRYCKIVYCDYTSETTEEFLALDIPATIG